MITYDLLQSMINPFKSFIKTFSLKALFVIFRFKFSLIVDINCDVTSIYVKTEALIMKQVSYAAAPRIHYAFRGRLVGLLVLTHCGVPPMTYLPQESSCIPRAGIAFANNSVFP